MASDFCNIPPKDETKQILDLLPPLPSIQMLVEIIMKKTQDIKNRFITKIESFIPEFLDQCPSTEEIEKIIVTRNNVVQQLNQVYTSLDRTANLISGVSKFLTVIITAIKVSQGLITALNITQLVSPIIPNPVLVKINAGTETAQDFLDKIRFKADGDPKLVPLVTGIISASVATQLLLNTFKNFICVLEGLDVRINECLQDSPQKPSIKLTPLDPLLLEAVNTTIEQNQSSLLDTTYRGFSFEIEEVPFSPTTVRKRALAKNSDNITLLQTELSFTTTPDILIQELKLVIDRDNLRAD